MADPPPPPLSAIPLASFGGRGSDDHNGRPDAPPPPLSLLAKGFSAAAQHMRGRGETNGDHLSCAPLSGGAIFAQQIVTSPEEAKHEEDPETKNPLLLDLVPSTEEREKDREVVLVGGGGGGGGGGRRRSRNRSGSSSTPSRINWSFRETVILLDAKKRDAEEHGNSALGRAGAGGRHSNNTDRWDRIAEHCLSQGAKKTGNQCSNRWDKLWPRFKKLFDYERSGHGQGAEPESSYWRMPLHSRQRLGLPDSFNRDVFDAMADRFGAERAAKTAGVVPPVARIARPDINADKVSTTSTLVEGNNKRTVPPPHMSGEEIDNGAGEPTMVKKRSREPENHGPVKEPLEGANKQLFRTYERLESARQSCYERMFEDVATMIKDKTVAEERSTAMVCSSLNRIADALNNVAAMAAKR